jgi:uncharacterized membrane protein YoaK (UPF0700 family)
MTFAMTISSTVLTQERKARESFSRVPMNAAPSVDDSPALKLLPFVLSLVAGSLDIIGFRGLDGLLTAHITGNLVILAAKVVAHDPSPWSYTIAVPVFMVMVGLTRLLVAGLERIRIPSLLPLLALQFIFVAAFLGICVAAGRNADPHKAQMVFAGMLGVTAMAVQNALVRISISGAPSTAPMTTNITAFTIAAGDILLGHDRHLVAKAREQMRHTWPAIVGFVVGCALGAASESTFGLTALVIPMVLSGLAFALGFAGTRRAS